MDNDQSRPAASAKTVPGMNAAATQALPQISSEEAEEGLALGEIIAVLIDYRWLIATISLLAVAIGLAWLLVSSRCTGQMVCCRSRKKAPGSAR